MLQILWPALSNSNRQNSLCVDGGRKSALVCGEVFNLETLSQGFPSPNPVVLRSKSLLDGEVHSLT